MSVWERRWAWGGVAFVVLVVAWMITILVLDPVGFAATDEEVRTFFAPEDGDSGGLLVAGVFMALALVAFMAFLGVLRSALRVAEGGTGRIAAVAFAGGVLVAGTLLLINSIIVGISFGVAATDMEVDPDAYRLVNSIVFGLLIHLGVASAVLVAATSIVAKRTGLFPAWLAWAGDIVSVLALFAGALFGLPLFLVVLWVLAVSLMLLRTAQPAAAATPAAAPPL
jgi:hypothetical protein